MAAPNKKKITDLLTQLIGVDGEILVIDPSEPSRTLIKGFFAKLDIANFRAVSSTAEAKRIMLSSKVKLIICEWVMDKQNGIQFCRELRKIEQYQSTPFILLSAENLRSDVVLASEVNIDRYIIKPFSFDVFVNQLLGLCKLILFPTEYDLSIKSANLALLKGELDEAEAHFSRAAAVDHSAAKPILGKAKVELARGNLDSAQLLVENTLRQNPEFVEAHRTLLKIYQEKENNDGVYKEAEYLHNVSPENPFYILILAEKEISLNNFAKAESLYKSVLIKSPKIAQAHKGLGDISFANEEFDKAEKHYKKAIGLEPSDLSALNQLGMTFVKKGAVKEGVQMYLTGLKIDPTNPKLLFNLGKAYEEMGMPREAYNYYLSALNEAPYFKKAARAVERLQNDPKVTGSENLDDEGNLIEDDGNDGNDGVMDLGFKDDAS